MCESVRTSPSSAPIRPPQTWGCAGPPSQLCGQHHVGIQDALFVAHAVGPSAAVQKQPLPRLRICDPRAPLYVGRAESPYMCVGGPAKICRTSRGLPLVRRPGGGCACAAFVYTVRTSLFQVVNIAGVRRPVLFAGAVHACVVALASPMLALCVPAVHALAVHACVMRACASHARVAYTCCACPCCACPRCALPCWVCGVLVQYSPTSCCAR